MVLVMALLRQVPIGGYSGVAAAGRFGDIGLLAKWDKRTKQVVERQNAKMRGDDGAQPADDAAQTRVERWWWRFETVWVVIFAIVLFALAVIGLVIFIASGV